MLGYIYQIEFPDGMVYVGSTTKPVRYRISGHITSLRKNQKPVKSLIEPFVKWGWTNDNGIQSFNANVSFTEYDVETRQELFKLEQKHMRAIAQSQLLNIRETGIYCEQAHNFLDTPVDCSAWVNLLFGE